MAELARYIVIAVFFAGLIMFGAAGAIDARRAKEYAAWCRANHGVPVRLYDAAQRACADGLIQERP